MLGWASCSPFPQPEIVKAQIACPSVVLAPDAGEEENGGITEVSFMKRGVLLLFLAAVVALAGGQNSGSFNLKVKANSQLRKGSVLQCRGDVEMETDTMILRTDEVDYHTDSGLAEARGNVKVQLLPVAPKH